MLNQPHLSDLEQMAQHDLYWCCLLWGHKFYRNGDTLELWGGAGGKDSLDVYREINPNMIYLAGLSAVWEKLDTFPPDSDYWLRDEYGEILKEWDDSGVANLNHPGVQKRIIDRAVAVSKCGLYDGIFFDGWSERYADRRGTLGGAEAILKGIREQARENFLILVNTNDATAPVSAPYINGLFLESGVPGGWPNRDEGFTVLENTLAWAEENLREPQINAIEGETSDEPLDSPRNLRWMRAITTLGLTFSDGFVLFMISEWKGKHRHWHYWYDFWDADLGHPLGEKSQFYEGRPGLYIREYTNGWAVYNRSGEAQVVTLPAKVRSVTSGLSNTKHAVLNLDGDILLNIPPLLPGDINGDGIVNILDLTLVAQAFGTDSRESDVNGDGVVNVFDLVFVAGQF